MMSTFELTLLSWLHCQSEPDARLIGRVSFEPVENVVSSPVRKVLPVAPKSTTKSAFSNPAGKLARSVPKPLASVVKSESQSFAPANTPLSVPFVVTVQTGLPGQVSSMSVKLRSADAALPSSWKPTSWTANTPIAPIARTPTAAPSPTKPSRARRLRRRDGRRGDGPSGTCSAVDLDMIADKRDNP